MFETIEHLNVCFGVFITDIIFIIFGLRRLMVITFTYGRSRWSLPCVESFSWEYSNKAYCNYGGSSKRKHLFKKEKKCFGMKPTQKTDKLVCGMLLLNVADILLHHVAQAKIRKNVCIGTIWVPICEMK